MNIPTTQQRDSSLGWKTLGVFVPTFVAGWIAGIVVGLATRQIGLLLNLSEPVGHTLSWLGITAARVIRCRYVSKQNG